MSELVQLATTETRPSELLVEVFNSTKQYGMTFGNSQGWWCNGVMAVYLGEEAGPDQRWFAACAEEEDSDCRCECHCCEECVVCSPQCSAPGACPDLEFRQEGAIYPMQSLLAKAARWERIPVMLGNLFVDPLSLAHVPVLDQEGKEIFAVKPSFLETAQRFGQPENWWVGDKCLVGERNGDLVALVMQESRA